MWNSKAELVKRAAVIAKEKHGGDFNKSQLIAASKEVYGGFADDPSKPIKTMEDANNAGNAMANIDGHYPTGMSGCYVVGLNGGCGLNCPVFAEGDCGEPQEFDRDDVIEACGENVADQYNCFDLIAID